MNSRKIKKNLTFFAPKYPVYDDDVEGVSISDFFIIEFVSDSRILAPKKLFVTLELLIYIVAF